MPNPVNLAPCLQVDGCLRRVAHWLTPHRCLACREPADAPCGRLCSACLASLPWNRSACARCAMPLPFAADACGTCLQRPPPVTSTRAAFIYGAPVDRLLPRLKFHRDLAAGRLLAGRMAEAFAEAPRPQALVPIPLHCARLRQRGYDQALELARPLSQALGLPLQRDLLVRSRETAAQSRLDARARKRNLRGAFVVCEAGPLPAHVALVDDVMTTGATLHAAARALRRAGVARVDAWVCARVP